MRITLSKHTYTIVFLFATLTFFCSCNKSDQAKSNSFTWVHNGISHTTQLDTAYKSAGGLSLFPYGIIAGDKKPGYIIFRRVEFSLTSFNVGTHTIKDGLGMFGPVNDLDYTDDGGNLLIGIGGTLTITANSNNYMSGNFSVTVITGSGTPSLLTGNFNNMPVR